MTQRGKVIMGLLAIGLGLQLVGCASGVQGDRRHQMERVARDWTTTIRASQVVPVYPLTQDFHPGDVFLVQQSVRAQEAAFDEKGFLPIDMQIARVIPSGYESFYVGYNNLGPDSPVGLPSGWPLRGNMPRAGFPAYGFTVSRQAGLSLAVPVQAVPVGLSLMGASEASGTISISDAFTYGTDVASLLNQVRSSESIRGFLEQLHIPEGETYYLRVVNRVFATRKMVVTLTTGSGAAGGLDVGVPKPVGADGEQRSSIGQVRAINESLSEALPGGSVRAVSAQNRSITFDETFSEPVVFGYHGFDMAILPDGTLGSVVPTFSVLESGALPPTTGVSPDDVAYLAVLGLLESIESQSAELVRGVFDEAAGMDEFLDEAYQGLRERGRKGSSAWKQAVMLYKNDADSPEEGRARLRRAQRWLNAAAKSARVDLSGGGS